MEDHSHMDAVRYSRVGTCRCGETSIEVTAPPIMTSACHCRGCQRMSSSAYSLTARFTADAFRVLTGEPVTGGLRGPRLKHFFCPACMTWMFTRIVGADHVVNVRPTMFDDPGWGEPFIEVMTAEKLPWVQMSARHSYANFPEAAESQRLLQEFADQRQASKEHP